MPALVALDASIGPHGSKPMHLCFNFLKFPPNSFEFLNELSPLLFFANSQRSAIKIKPLHRTVRANDRYVPF